MHDNCATFDGGPVHYLFVGISTGKQRLKEKALVICVIGTEPTNIIQFAVAFV
jgi:hypothetical protein